MNKRRIVSSVGLMAAVLCFVTSCRHAPTATERPLVFLLESEPERLAPLTIRNPQTFRVAWQIYEGLLGLSEEGHIEPRLAESWTTTDQQTWRFTLREGVRFHASELFGAAGASRAVTSDDVVWSYRAYCAPGTYAAFVLADSVQGCADYNSGKAKQVSGVRAIDARTVEIRLLKPEAFFLHRITTAWIAIFPKESEHAAFRDRWGLQIAVGTGPFRLVSRAETDIVVERNPDYWDKARRPAVSRVHFRVVKNEQVRLAEVANGSVDLMVVPQTLVPALLDGQAVKSTYADRYAIKVVRTFNHHLIGFNLAALPDVHLRRAMSLGTDRRTLVSTLLGGYGDVMGGPVPPVMTSGANALPEARFDQGLARQELRQSQYRGVPIELLVHDLADSERVGAVFQQQMKSVGINIRLTRLDFGSVIGRVIKGDAAMFGMFAEIVFSSPEPLLLNLFSSPKIPVPNFWKYADRGTDAALLSLGAVTDDAERLRRAAAVEQRIVSDVPAIFLYSQRDVVLHSKRLSGVTINPHEHYQLERIQVRP